VVKNLLSTLSQETRNGFIITAETKRTDREWKLPISPWSESSRLWGLLAKWLFWDHRGAQGTPISAVTYSASLTRLHLAIKRKHSRPYWKYVLLMYYSAVPKKFCSASSGIYWSILHVDLIWHPVITIFLQCWRNILEAIGLEWWQDGKLQKASPVIGQGSA
jgi:hypothetical protein